MRELLKNAKSPMMQKVVSMLGKNKKRPLGKLNPWAWWVEITRGCNLRCDFCPTRLFPVGEIQFMQKDVWTALLKTIQEVTPYCRLEFGNGGEPSLHPQLLEYLQLARATCPNIQMLMYTNGTQITNRRLTYKQLFDSGLNMIFLDMYASQEEHERILKESGYYWFHQDDKPKDAPNIFQYQKDAKMHVVMLANNPYNWSKRKLGRGYLHTFFNDLDWEAASKFGLEPVNVAPNRRCDLPNKFVNINYDGTFAFCCLDFLRHTAHNFGNIKNGVYDFFAFWLGSYMQDVRRKLYNKDRNAHEYCSKCKFTSIRCDIPYWKPEMLEHYWEGEWK